MSILIKGMEMPNNCYECPFAMSHFTTLYTQRNFSADYSCVITHKTLTSTKRNRFCPLVQVPPHGRLIDADALLKRWCNEVCKPKPNCEEDCDTYYYITSAPTIVEAEESE